MSFSDNVDINSNSTENELFDKLYDFSCSHIFWRIFLTDFSRDIVSLNRTPAGLWDFASHMVSKDTIPFWKYSGDRAAEPDCRVRSGAFYLINLRYLALPSFHDFSSQIYLEIFGSAVSPHLICTAVMNTDVFM